MDPEDPGRSADGRDGGRPGQGTTPLEAVPPEAEPPAATRPEAEPPEAESAEATRPEAEPPAATRPEAEPPEATPPGTAPEPAPAAARRGDADQDRGGAAPGAAVPLLSLQGAAKSFGAVRAIVDASIDLYGGEVNALVGENGAGKSTLVKILAGVHRPDSGQLLVNGTPTVLHGPAAAQDAGIAVIYQEPTLFPDLTAAENIFMGRQPLRRGRRIDARQMRAQARALFGRLGVRLDPGRICRGLSIADQQIIEIAKALSLEARVIVMDEPTAALSAAEVARLFDVAATLRASGAAVLFISHRLEEVFEIGQRVTVMRDGRRVLSQKLADLTADDLVRAMVGRQLDDRAADGHHTPGRSCCGSSASPGRGCSPTSRLTCGPARSWRSRAWSGPGAAR
jgi:ABC-type branched-subunit amino acid transport system ATPase component